MVDLNGFTNVFMQHSRIIHLFITFYYNILCNFISRIYLKSMCTEIPYFSGRFPIASVNNNAKVGNYGICNITFYYTLKNILS